VYPLLLSGWSSNRKYALLGGLRGVAQTISYEIRLALIILIFLIYINTYNLELFIIKSAFLSIIILCPLIIVFWIISCLAETNRTPFDFSEGESELVSGFNIEYGSGGFAIIFIAEYARILFLRELTRFLAFGFYSINIYSQIIAILLVFFWV
jgi:NADH-ubiquinone oxidoreductase chain 1